MDLNIPAKVHYKKTDQLAITVIKSPHVHKKSRDQYKIDRYCAFSQVLARPRLDVGANDDRGAIARQDREGRFLTAQFLEFKNDSYRLHLDEGFSLTPTYPKREDDAF
jgi:hypothetical protein